MAVFSSFFRTSLTGLAGLAASLINFGAAAQAPNADAIAQKAYAARHDRVYLLGGAAMPDYTKLNEALERSRAFPTLRAGAFMLGAGYGQGFSSYGLALEYRLTVRANDTDSTRAYTSLTTNTFGLMARYNLFVTRAYTFALLAGPVYNRLSLTLKEGVPPGTSPITTFESQLRGGNKRKLYQSQFGVSLGGQLERHFMWSRRNDVQACGRARQITVGGRIQADFVTKYYRWHTEQPVFRSSTKLGYDPKTNPVRFSAALVVGGIFSRY